MVFMYRGLKVLGVRDLTYRLAFLACSVTPTESKVCCDLALQVCRQ